MDGLRDKVRTILNRLKVENAPVPIDDVVKLFSIPVVNYSHFPESVSGTFIKDEDFQVIGINDKMANTRKRYTIAHELGHYFLGHDHQRSIHENFDEPTDKEREANKFAAELLMPIDFLKKDVEKIGITVPDLSKKYEVSDQAMSIRLLETKLIDKIKSA